MSTTSTTTAAQSLTTRLSALSESNKTAVQLIQRLSKLNFQPGSTPLEGEEGDVRLELGSEIHESLKQLEEELELLKQEVEEITEASSAGSRRRDTERDTERDSERARLVIQVARLTEDLKQSRSLFRKAQLQAKRNSELAKQKERELLFSSLQEGSGNGPSGRRKGQEKLTKEELEAHASSDVTAALRRTHELMQNELSRSQFAQEALNQSSAALADLGERYSNLDTLLSNSRNLVSSLITSQKSDTWYLETTLYVILFTFAWLVLRIIFRRLQVIYWIVWLLFLPFKFTFQILFATAPSKAGAALTPPSEVVSVRESLSHISSPPQASIMSGKGVESSRAGQDPSKDGSISQKVGQMAEAAERGETYQPPVAEGSQAEPILRGDGVPLVSSDKPRNPKKRMWDEDVERAKYEQAQAEAQARDQAQAQPQTQTPLEQASHDEL